MIRVFLLQCVKQQIYRVLESLVILPDLHSVYHFHQRGKVLLIGGRFIIDVADQRRIEQCFGLDPEIVSRFPFAFRVGDQHRYQFENVLLIVDIRKRVIVHTL